jgi:hypothetical protein
VPWAAVGRHVQVLSKALDRHAQVKHTASCRQTRLLHNLLHRYVQGKHKTDTAQAAVQPGARQTCPKAARAAVKGKTRSEEAGKARL